MSAIPYDAHGGIDDVVPADALAPAGATIAAGAEGEGAETLDGQDGALERKGGGA